MGLAAKNVAPVLQPQLRENELALPKIGIARELAQDKTSPDFAAARRLFLEFKQEYVKMLQEHQEILD